MTYLYYFNVLFLFFFSFKTFSQDKESVKNNSEKTKAESKVYNQQEFDSAVKEEVSRTLKRLKEKNVEVLANEILDKEKQVVQKEKELSKREEQLSVNEKDLISKVKGLEDLQQKILGCIDKNEAQVNQRVQHVVKVIGGMRPAKAAEILSVQEPQIAVKILGLVSPDKASKIFNVMDKEISARIQRQYLDMKK